MAMSVERKTRIRTFLATAGQTWLNVGGLLILLLFVYGPYWIPSGSPSRDKMFRPRTDLMMFYGSALLLRESPEKLYDVTRQAAAQKTATGLEISENDVDFLPFPYPAVVALAFVPLTFITYKTAYLFVILVNLALLGISVWILSKRLNLDDSANRVLVLCATASLGVYAVLLQGQVSLLILLISVLAITNLRNGSERAGTWAGLLAFKPTVLPVWLFWFAIRRQWRALGYALGVSGAIAVASTLLVGLEGTASYLHMSQRMVRGDFFTVLPTNMPTLKALTYFFGLGNLVWLGAVAAVLLALWSMRPSTVWEGCNLIVATILVAPHMHPQEMVLLLIAVALLLARQGTSTSRIAVWSLFGFMLWQSYVRASFGGINGSHWPAMPLTLLGVFIYFLYRSRNETGSIFKAAGTALHNPHSEPISEGITTAISNARGCEIGGF